MRLSFLFICLCLFFSCTKEKQYAAITGYVSDKYTGEALHHIKVSLFDGDKEWYTYTDPTGYYFLEAALDPWLGNDPFYDMLVNGLAQQDSFGNLYGYWHFIHQPRDSDFSGSYNIGLDGAGYIKLLNDGNGSWDFCEVQGYHARMSITNTEASRYFHPFPGNQDIKFYYFKNGNLYDSARVNIDVLNRREYFRVDSMQSGQQLEIPLR